LLIALLTAPSAMLIAVVATFAALFPGCVMSNPAAAEIVDLAVSRP
jgi:hypothetical protein